MSSRPARTPHAARTDGLGGGHVDVLVDSAGIFPFGPVAVSTQSDVDSVLAQPEEIAEAIVFLATDAASFIHGAVLPVDGGRIAV